MPHALVSLQVNADFSTHIEAAGPKFDKEGEKG